jgi:hypothetical protein
MSEHLEEAVNELKRADHMIFVSLKYTRTCDVIKNIVERLMNCFDFTYDYLIEQLKEKKAIGDIPNIKSAKVDLLRDYFKDNKDFLDFYNFYIRLRKINKADFTRSQEFRRHVTLTAVLDDGVTVELNIDSIHDYYLKTKSFVDFSVNFINPVEH